MADRSLLTSKLSIIPDGSTIANGVTDSITRIINLAGNVGIGILQLIFIRSIPRAMDPESVILGASLVPPRRFPVVGRPFF